MTLWWLVRPPMNARNPKNPVENFWNLYLLRSGGLSRIRRPFLGEENQTPRHPRAKPSMNRASPKNPIGNPWNPWYSYCFSFNVEKTNTTPTFFWGKKKATTKQRHSRISRILRISPGIPGIVSFTIKARTSSSREKLKNQQITKLRKKKQNKRRRDPRPDISGNPPR